MATRYEESAGVLVYYTKDNEIYFLLLKYPTYWGFCKGIIEQNESVEETARRELEEETGIKSIDIIPGFRHTQEWFFRAEGQLIRKKATYLLAKVTEKEADGVIISSEHEDFQWLNYQDSLIKMKIKNNKDMLKAAYDIIKNHEEQKKLF